MSKHSRTIYLLAAAYVLCLALWGAYRYTGMRRRVRTLRQMVPSLPPCPRTMVAKVAGYHTTRTVAPKETLASILADSGFSPQEQRAIIQRLSAYMDPRRIKAGSRYHVGFRRDLPCSFELQLDPLRWVKIRKKRDNTFSDRLLEAQVHTDRRLIWGRIETSLYQALEDQREKGALAVELSEIFAFDIDFFSDIRKGDLFVLVVDKQYVKDTFIGYGRIQGAAIAQKGAVFKAYFFPCAQEKLAGYYNEKGQSMEKDFLKAPLNYKRISSHFSLRRFHPVLKRYMAHRGVDYAAPRGTPVVALGDGKVVKAGWNGGLGKYIEIKHNSVYSTCYGHLCGFAPHIRRGRRVKKGELIAYVGSTGLSTGPHLDFRVKKNKTYINPLRIKPKRKVDLTGDLLAEYMQHSKRIRLLVDTHLHWR